MYSVEFSKSAQIFFKKLDNFESKVIAKKIEEMRRNPFRNLKRLQGNKLWRLRVGDYRVIVDVIVANNKIFVVRIGKRSGVYD